MDRIKIFTQNLYWIDPFKRNERMREVKKYIHKKKFDFVFLQEAVLNLDVKRIKQDSFGFYVKGRLGPKGGLAIISRKEFDKIEFHKFKVQGAIFSRQILDRIIEKGFLAGYIEDKIYINTHLIYTYNKEYGKNVENLNKQFEQLLNFVKEKIREGKDVILGGDFNFGRDSKNYKKITNILTDNTTHPKITSKFNSNKQIDFIFSSEKSSKNYMPSDYHIFVSDHSGIGISLIS